MSLILDALRKSEAERRRGQVPDLRAELPPLVRASASPRRRWPVWFAGSAALLAAAALGWSVWVSRPPMPADASAAIAPGIDPAPTRQADPSPETSPALPQAPRPLPSAAVRAAPPQPQPARPVADAAYATAPSTPSREITAATPTAPPSMPAPAPEAESVPAVAEASAASAPPAPAAAPALPPPTPATGSTVRLIDLSPGEREQLPALKISMHMWGPTPAQRFAIIDGTRVGQGDRIGETVVEEIAADGVVLNWHGRRVALPLR